ncbi:MAG: glycosyltransferase family 4 protein [Candidatus Levybacteria bacterium]|nr:glycosyltransferase family 4 protein [Candidatus Levybacteria bacterium]
MKILQVADRPGWAVDRLSKPLTGDNVDICYFEVHDRFLDTGYTEKGVSKPYSLELANNYDVVHFHRWKAAELVVNKLNVGIKTVLSLHNEHDFKEADLSLYDVIICPTNYIFDNVEHPRKFLVPYGIDLKKYQYDFKEHEDNVGFIGRVIPHKRFEKIHYACLTAGIQLIATGYIEDPKLFGKYKGHALGKGVRDPIFTSMLPEVQMPDFYHKLKFLVSVSEERHETGPLPVLEAMASGVPVISTQVGWARDWCRHGENIWFVGDKTVNDQKKLGKLLYDLLQRKDIQIRLRNNGMMVVSKFGLDRYKKSLMQIYEDITNC